MSGDRVRITDKKMKMFGKTGRVEGHPYHSGKLWTVRFEHDNRLVSNYYERQFEVIPK